MNVRAIFNSLIGLAAMQISQGSEHSTPIPGNFFLAIWKFHGRIGQQKQRYSELQNLRQIQITSRKCFYHSLMNLIKVVKVIRISIKQVQA